MLDLVLRQISEITLVTYYELTFARADVAQSGLWSKTCEKGKEGLSQELRNYIVHAVLLIEPLNSPSP